MTAGGVQLRWIGGQAVVVLPAEIDASNADAVRQALLAEARRDRDGLIIDMSQTTFCDSAGVQAIIDTYNHSPVTRLRLVAPAVMRIFTLTGVDQLIPGYPTLQAALSPGPRQATAIPADQPPGSPQC